MTLFPKMDLAAWCASQGLDDMHGALRGLAGLYADVDARNAKNTGNLELPCARGCADCCNECVFLTPLEFAYAWGWVQENLASAARDAIVWRGLALYERHRGLIDAFDGPTPVGERDHFTIAKTLRFQCPLLGAKGDCLAYPARELLARLFGCSFNDAGGIYGCNIVGERLAGKTVTLLPARGTLRRLRDLPLTDQRQVYPYYFHVLYAT